MEQLFIDNHWCTVNHDHYVMGTKHLKATIKVYSEDEAFAVTNLTITAVSQLKDVETWCVSTFV